MNKLLGENLIINSATAVPSPNSGNKQIYSGGDSVLLGGNS